MRDEIALEAQPNNGRRNSESYTLSYNTEYIQNPNLSQLNLRRAKMLKCKYFYKFLMAFCMITLIVSGCKSAPQKPELSEEQKDAIRYKKASVRLIRKFEADFTHDTFGPFVPKYDTYIYNDGRVQKMAFYDEDGIARTIYEYVYDSEGRLVGSRRGNGTVVNDYTYDENGYKIRENINSKREYEFNYQGQVSEVKHINLAGENEELRSTDKYEYNGDKLKQVETTLAEEKYPLHKILYNYKNGKMVSTENYIYNGNGDIREKEVTYYRPDGQKMLFEYYQILTYGMLKGKMSKSRATVYKYNNQDLLIEEFQAIYLPMLSAEEKQRISDLWAKIGDPFPAKESDSRDDSFIRSDPCNKIIYEYEYYN